ncbi:hypothetical protein LTS18_007659 [Coniosporium uncinatum]|uniref:Uncharacterized protein n=1 Tax=Coniosporium uncinatum TaxID=93489 RepID=A0ACC3D2A8_9PEZI|nr:hypothetical protein LTS18_007659 [Coniosporium uncinatum]
MLTSPPQVYMTFKKPFWNSALSKSPPVPRHPSQHPPPPKIPNVPATTLPLHLSTSSSLSSTTDTVTDAYDPTPGFVTYLYPTYAPATNPSRWIQEAVNLAALPPSCAHPTLLFYTHGPCSQHISSLIARHASTASSSDDAAPRNQKEEEFANITPSSNPRLFAALHAFFLPYLRLLPNYDDSASSSSSSASSSSSPSSSSARQALHTPLSILPTNWTADPLAGEGSYTNFQVGGERLDEDVTVLRKGMPERRVWFAGEHTAPFVALGTVTGAWWAGEGVAGRVAGLYMGGAVGEDGGKGNGGGREGV